MPALADEKPPPERADEPASEENTERANIVTALATEPGQPADQIKGRIDIEDEVVEKVAGLAATEVEGVADLGGDVARTVENVRERIGVGHRRGDQGVKASIDGQEVSIEVTIVIEYGHVVMEVARLVKANVATQTNRMLGLRVVEVNVTVDDVRMPVTAKEAAAAGEERLTIG
ncbi:Asp23/Gls24 family envelope stress response protein [Actinomadura sp. DC4]|uniref:Asp23/Gls24 family envelope stress response protein n=1 Tax=Actinomadura sp. DC4 TaxID=3055069 RepID=UPI0025AECEBB|nr:Asp23/Gls24 family envelope stress response protein [Actinomadura sp. DC4]MDN3358011.1 Asp23/Gls24 family envelope stress response protein [Actinomadura sp. DC4]